MVNKKCPWFEISFCNYTRSQGLFCLHAVPNSDLPNVPMGYDYITQTYLAHYDFTHIVLVRLFLSSYG